MIYNIRKTEKTQHINMVKRSLYNDMCMEKYESKIMQTEKEFWEIWSEVYDDLKEIFKKKSNSVIVHFKSS